MSLSSLFSPSGRKKMSDSSQNSVCRCGNGYASGRYSGLRFGIVVIGLLALSLTVACMVQAEAVGEKTKSDAPSSADRKEKTIRFVCFGDSLTGHRPFTDYQKDYLKYADLLQLMIEAKRGIGTVEMLNAGWAGDATYPKPNESWPGARGRVKSDIIEKKPDFVTVLIGGNDKVENDEDRARTLANLDAIVKEITDAKIKVLLLQYPPAMPGDEFKDKGWYHLSSKNDLIAKVGEKYNVPVLDLGPAMAEAAKKYDKETLVVPQDGVHLKPRGEKVFARAIFAKVKDLGWIDD